MAHDMREFIESLESRGLLRRVKAEVSPLLEVPEILRRVMYAHGPAVLFENVRGHPGWRIVGNLFCCDEAVKVALGVSSVDEVGQRVSSLLRAAGGDLRSAMAYVALTPRSASRAEFVEDPSVNLSSLPAFKTWPKDGGRYLTYPLVVHYEEVDGRRSVNFGVYRVMIVNDREAVVHMQTYKRGFEEWQHVAQAGGCEMKAAIVIGAPPEVLLAGAMPAPKGVDKYVLASIVGNRPVELYTLPSGVPVPSSAEVVLEGTLDLCDLREEGPFGDHIGFYDVPDRRFPTFKLERSYVRPNPIYYGTVVGRPPLEDSVIGRVSERAFLPLIRFLFPEVVDVRFPESGWFQGLALVSIDKTMPGQAKRVAMGLLGLGQFSLTKIIVVVDKDIDLRSADQVTWAVSTFVDPARDLVVVNGAPADELDLSTLPRRRVGSKLIVDATRKLRDELGAEPPEELRPDPETERLVSSRWKEYGL